MSKHANPTSIGLFFAVGLALGVASLLLFSSRSRFHPHQKSILYFNTSLKGLDPGAPVKYRGVTIGVVLEVLIRHNQAGDDFSMPVIISVDKKLAQAKSDALLEISSQAKLDQMIKQGFRGRLDAESLVTGILHVALDIVPDAPPPVFHQLKPEYQEIPTMPTDVQQLLANLSHFDLQGISDKLNALLTRLDSSLGQLNMSAINNGVTNLLVAAHELIAMPDLTNAITSARQTLDNADVLLKRIDARVDPLTDNLTNTLFEAQQTLAGLRGSVAHVNSLLAPDSPFRSDLAQALEDLGHAGRAVADLAEFLQRNPNALLMGRKQPKEK